jgi:hypothetical protein
MKVNWTWRLRAWLPSTSWLQRRHSGISCDDLCSLEHVHASEDEVLIHRR